MSKNQKRIQRISLNMALSLLLVLVVLINSKIVTMAASDSKLHLNQVRKMSVSEVKKYSEITIGKGGRLEVTGNSTWKNTVPIKVMDGGVLTVEGSMTSSNNVVVEKGTIKIGGSYTQSAGYLYIKDSCTVKISKNITFSDKASVLSDCASQIVVGQNVSYKSTSNSETNHATWVVSGKVTQSKTAGKLHFWMLHMLDTCGVVTLPKGDIEILVLYGNKKNYTITKNCYKEIGSPVRVHYNLNGGKGELEDAYLAKDKPYYYNITPQRLGYIFNGWYTEANGGERVADLTKYGKEITVYAHWMIRGSIADVSQFVDVNMGDWYANAVIFVFNEKIMQGVSDNRFGSGDAITRAQFVTALYRFDAATDGEKFVEYKAVFDDVPDKQYYTNAVMWAYNSKIVYGVSETKFGGDNLLTREQLATMLYNYAEFMKYDTTSDSKALDRFEDKNQVSSWAAQAMKWAVKNKVLQGSGKNLNPQGTATRAECAQMLMNYYTNVVK